jgi:hypothetical protein
MRETHGVPADAASDGRNGRTRSTTRTGCAEEDEAVVGIGGEALERTGGERKSRSAGLVPRLRAEAGSYGVCDDRRVVRLNRR